MSLIVIAHPSKDGTSSSRKDVGETEPAFKQEDNHTNMGAFQHDEKEEEAEEAPAASTRAQTETSLPLNPSDQRKTSENAASSSHDDDTDGTRKEQEGQKNQGENTNPVVDKKNLQADDSTTDTAIIARVSATLRQRALEAIRTASGFSHNLKWETMFRRLVEYKNEHGNCLVPNRYRHDTKLGSWVSTQRRQFKATGVDHKGKATVLSRNRIGKLNDIGFVWETSDPRRVDWEARYDQLCEFRRVHGNAMVPMGYSKNVGLANWVSVQRQEFKNLLVRRPSKMTSKRIKLLKTIDFIWKAPRGARRKYFPDDPKRRNPFINKSGGAGEGSGAGNDPSDDDDTGREEEESDGEQHQQEPSMQPLLPERPFQVRSTMVAIAVPDQSTSDRQVLSCSSSSDDEEDDHFLRGATRNEYAEEPAVILPHQQPARSELFQPAGPPVPALLAAQFPLLHSLASTLQNQHLPGGGRPTMGAPLPYDQLLAFSTAAATFAAEAKLVYQQNATAAALRSFPTRDLLHNPRLLNDLQMLTVINSRRSFSGAAVPSRSQLFGSQEVKAEEIQSDSHVETPAFAYIYKDGSTRKNKNSKRKYQSE